MSTNNTTVKITSKLQVSVGFESYLRRHEIELTDENYQKHYEDYQKENKKITGLRKYMGI